MTTKAIEIAIQHECDRLLKGKTYSQDAEAEVLVALRRVANVAFTEGATVSLEPKP